jgi:bacteriocin leader peptide (microcyclamide/patellamide family)
MNNKSITPNPQQPVDRVPTGQLPSALAELSEAELSDCQVRISYHCSPSLGGAYRTEYVGGCSFDGDDE